MKKDEKKEDKNKKPQPPQALSETELTAENLAKQDTEMEMANSFSDNEYVQTQNMERFSFLINNIRSPEDLSFIQTSKHGWHGRRITDMDGDGVEDNETLEADELDKYYDPLYFGDADDINNTRHGKLPGHKQMWFTESLVEPPVHAQTIVQDKWETK